MTFLILSFMFLFASGQEPHNPFLTDAQVITQQGSLFSIALAKGEPIKIFVVGKKQAEIDLSTSEWGLEFDPSDLTLRVRRVGPKLSEIVKVERQKNHFVIANPDTDEKVYTLEVTTQVKGKKEEKFKFKIDNRPK